MVTSTTSGRCKNLRNRTAYRYWWEWHNSIREGCNTCKIYEIQLWHTTVVGRSTLTHKKDVSKRNRYCRTLENKYKIFGAPKKTSQTLGCNFLKSLTEATFVGFFCGVPIHSDDSSIDGTWRLSYQLTKLTTTSNLLRCPSLQRLPRTAIYVDEDAEICYGGYLQSFFDDDSILERPLFYHITRTATRLNAVKWSQLRVQYFDLGIKWDDDPAPHGVWRCQL